MTKYVFLVYCDNMLTGLSDPPTLEIITSSFDAAKKYLESCAYPGHVERWPIDAVPDAIETVFTKTEYDHAAVEEEKKEWDERRRKANAAYQKLVKKVKSVNWT